MNSKQVEIAVVNYFGARQNLIVPNVSWGFGLPYEADMVVVSKSANIMKYFNKKTNISPISLSVLSMFHSYDYFPSVNRAFLYSGEAMHGK